MTGPAAGPGDSVNAAREALADARAAVAGLERRMDQLAAGAALVAAGLDPVRQAALQARLAAVEVVIEARRQAGADAGFLVLAESVRDLAGRIEGAAGAARRHLSVLQDAVAETRLALADPQPPGSGLRDALDRLGAALRAQGGCGFASGGSQPRS